MYIPWHVSIPYRHVINEIEKFPDLESFDGFNPL
mgnify:CR=1 FL=1